MKAKPIRIQLSRKKGTKIESQNGLPIVNCSRPGPWGNPFLVGKHGTRAECHRLFTLLCAGYLTVSKDAECVEAQMRWRKHALAHLVQLRGKNLACWCRLDGMCHCDILLRIANNPKVRP